MQRIKHTLSLLCLASLPGFWLQDSTQPQGEHGYPWDRLDKSKNERLLKQMEGAWRLLRISSQDLEPDARSETGVLLVTPDYLSFELHVGWSDPVGGLADWEFQSGIHRMSLDAQSNLQLRSVIGSYFDDAGQLEFESVGTARSYRPEVTGRTLILTSTATGSRLEFTRMENPSLDKKVDVYGRPIEPKSDDEPKPLIPPPGSTDH